MIPFPSIETIKMNGKRPWHEGDNYKYYIEEKVDGSQLSLFIENGNISFYNKNNWLPKMLRLKRRFQC